MEGGEGLEDQKGSETEAGAAGNDPVAGENEIQGAGSAGIADGSIPWR